MNENELNFDHLEDLISTLPDEKQSEVKRLFYGEYPDTLTIDPAAATLSEKHNFEIQAFAWKNAKCETQRKPRVVRVAGIQNSVVLPTTDPIEDQRAAIEEKLEHIIDAAALMGVNVLCLQEAWPMPFAFCTREKHPWMQFAETVEDGPSTKFVKRMARKYDMVIVSPILERDEEHQDIVWNTAVVVSHTGNVIGTSRKNHIPRIFDFNESTYYEQSQDGHPVFDTKYGKIGINICYGRHHPLNWLFYGVNGAEIVFNPSATVGKLSEPMWSIEARNAALANGYFTVGINRVGTETFPNEFSSGDGKPAHKDFGHFYGSTYVAAPNCSRTPAATRNGDALLLAEVDLNYCRQCKDNYCFQMTARYEMYAEGMTKMLEKDFKRQIIRDPALSDKE